MSACRTAQCDSSGLASRVRARASMARLASTPRPLSTWGATTSSSRPVPVPMSSNRPVRPPMARSRAALHGVRGQAERVHLVPIGAGAAEAFGGDARAFGQDPGSLAAVGLEHGVVGRAAGPAAREPGEPAPAGRVNHMLAPSRTPLHHPASQSRRRWRDTAAAATGPGFR